jgi:hypothetical protein
MQFESAWVTSISFSDARSFVLRCTLTFILMLRKVKMKKKYLKFQILGAVQVKQKASLRPKISSKADGMIFRKYWNVYFLELESDVIIEAEYAAIVIAQRRY